MRTLQISTTTTYRKSRCSFLFLELFLAAFSSHAQDMSPQRVQPEIVLPAGHAMNVRAIAFSPDGRWLASGGGDGTLQVWDVKTRRVWRMLGGQGGTINSIAFEPDSRRIAIAVRATYTPWIMRVSGTQAPKGNAIKMLDLLTGKLVWTVDYPFDITAIALNSDGRLLASAGTDKRVRVWNAEDGSLIRNFSAGPRGWMNCVAISPNGRWVASAGPRKIKIWDTSKGKLLAILSGHRKGIFALAFSPDGRWLVSGGGDQRVRLWDVTKKREARVWPLREEISAFAFSPDGRWLAWNDSFFNQSRKFYDTKITLWDFKSRRPGPAFEAYMHGPVSTIAFAQNGKQLAIAGFGQSIELWEPDTGAEVDFLMRGEGKAALALDKSGRWLIAASSEMAALKIHKLRQLNLLVS